MSNTSVSEAVASRRSIRQFLDQPVDPAALRRVLEKAQNSPSGGNTQPWNAHVLTGAPLAALLARVAEVVPQGRAAFAPEYHIYPPELEGAYEQRRFGVGEAMYAALGIPREDKMSRLAWFARNFQAFGAPVLMLIHTPRYMGPPQWSDIGMWLQTVMLLLREEGLDSCAQEAWAVYQKQIRECVNIPEDHIFFCGLAIGHGDRSVPINQFPVPRANLWPAAMTDLRLFNSLTRQLEVFQPVHPGEARVYTCGPTVYNYPHIGNMRAYVFADVLGRTLRFKGYKLTHVINITDVGHLTDDADAGEDKMERMAAQKAQSIWDIARHYTEAYWADIKALNIRQPAKWTIATDYIEQMIRFAKDIADKHCYELPSGLYFDVSTVADYGRLARAQTEEGANALGGRIDAVEGKRNAADFAIWRKTPSGEKRQMEWDSPWGRGAPGWHLECSVMSGEVLGFPFDIHTGGIDHREIHHPNEIAQNQAHCCTNGLDIAENSGARIWMHNNFLVERSGKMSKSAGEFLRLQLLIDKGYHPLAYRMMCLQAHYRSELEFSWEGLGAALVRLKRMVMAYRKWEPVLDRSTPGDSWEYQPETRDLVARFAAAISADLNTAEGLTLVEEALALKGVASECIVTAVSHMDQVLGLNLGLTQRSDLRLRPKAATIAEPEIEAILSRRVEARAAKDWTSSDRLRDELAAQGVEVMDGDPLGWDWKLG